MDYGNIILKAMAERIKALEEEQVLWNRSIEQVWTLTNKLDEANMLIDELKKENVTLEQKFEEVGK